MDTEKHERRFQHTNDLINEPIMNSDDTHYCDWLAIIMYYGAFHLVHKHCANRKDPCHPQDHNNVLNEAKRVKRGYVVYGEILTLYNAGLNARYEDVFLTQEDTKELKKSYNKIKQILA